MSRKCKRVGKMKFYFNQELLSEGVQQLHLTAKSCLFFGFPFSKLYTVSRHTL